MIVVRMITVTLVFLVVVGLSFFLYRQYKELPPGRRIIEKSQELRGKLLPDKADQQPPEKKQGPTPFPMRQQEVEPQSGQDEEADRPSSKMVEGEWQKNEKQNDEEPLSSLASSPFQSPLKREEEQREQKPLSLADLAEEEAPLKDVLPDFPVSDLSEERGETEISLAPPPPFAGRSLEEITREEISAILQKRREAERLLDAARRGGWR